MKCPDLIYIYGTVHPTTAIYAFFSNVHSMFTEIKDTSISWAITCSFKKMENIMKYWNG